VNSLDGFLLIVGVLSGTVVVVAAARRGYKPLQILDETLMGWLVIFIPLSHLVPALRLPAGVALSLILLRLVWNFVRKARR